MPPTLSRTHLPLLLLLLDVLIPGPFPMVCVSAPLVSVVDDDVFVLSVPSLSLLLLLLLLLLLGLTESDPDSDIAWDAVIRLPSNAIEETGREMAKVRRAEVFHHYYFATCNLHQRRLFFDCTSLRLVILFMQCPGALWVMMFY